MAQLDVLEEHLGVGSRYDTAAGRFGHLVRMSSARAGQRAVVLVDEYDKPILDALDVPEVARAKYRERGEPIHLIAVEFSKESRNLAAFDVEQA